MVESYETHNLQCAAMELARLALTPWLTSWVPKLFNLSKLRGRSLASFRDAREGFMEASMAPLVHVAVGSCFLHISVLEVFGASLHALQRMQF
jgi:hypothetical protein